MSSFKWFLRDSVTCLCCLLRHKYNIDYSFKFINSTLIFSWVSAVSTEALTFIKGGGEEASLMFFNLQDLADSSKYINNWLKYQQLVDIDTEESIWVAWRRSLAQQSLSFSYANRLQYYNPSGKWKRKSRNRADLPGAVCVHLNLANTVGKRSALFVYDSRIARLVFPESPERLLKWCGGNMHSRNFKPEKERNFKTTMQTITKWFSKNQKSLFVFMFLSFLLLVLFIIVFINFCQQFSAEVQSYAI